MRTTAQELVEHALATSTADDCIAIVRDVTSANLRWANNTLTTNGVMTEVSVTVISFASVAGGIATGSVSGSAASEISVEWAKPVTSPRTARRPNPWLAS